MEWNQPFPVMLLKPIELPDFVLVNFSVIAIEQVKCFLKNSEMSCQEIKLCIVTRLLLQMYPAGWWDELTVAFVFKRRYGWYLVQVYSVGYSLLLNAYFKYAFNYYRLLGM